MLTAGTKLIQYPFVKLPENALHVESEGRPRRARTTDETTVSLVIGA